MALKYIFNLFVIILVVKVILSLYTLKSKYLICSYFDRSTDRHAPASEKLMLNSSMLKKATPLIDQTRTGAEEAAMVVAILEAILVATMIDITGTSPSRSTCSHRNQEDGHGRFQSSPPKDLFRSTFWVEY